MFVGMMRLLVLVMSLGLGWLGLMQLRAPWQMHIVWLVGLLRTVVSPWVGELRALTRFDCVDRRFARLVPGVLTLVMEPRSSCIGIAALLLLWICVDG